MGNQHLRITPYARISDTDEERAPGIDRQLRIVHPLIKRLGGEVTKEYVDNDKSAYDPEVIRDEGFEPWLADFIEGHNDGIAAYDLDRLFRQPVDLERVIRAYVKAYKSGRPKPVLWLPSGSFDLTDADGQAMARVLVTFANQSSGKTVKRITDFYRDEALQGRIYSNYPAFGRDKGEINEKEAKIIRDGARELSAGVKATSLAKSWRDKGILTKRGKQWNGYAVKRLYLDPGIAGIAVYKGELLRHEDGKPITRVDGHILEIADWEEICLVIQPGKRERQTKSLLGGITRCGKCGRKMVRFPRKNGRFSYGCQSKDMGGCAGVTINGNQVDVLITEFIQELLKGQEVEAPAFTGQKRLDEIARIKRENQEARNAGSLSLSQWISSLKSLEAEEGKLKAEAAKLKRKVKIVATTEFPDLPLDKQRAIIRTFIEAVVIAPSGKTGKFDPGRITIVPTE